MTTTLTTTTTGLTADQFKAVLPKQLRSTINQQLIDKINSAITDPLIRGEVRDNIIGYAHVMKDGKFKVQSYLDAVKYVSYKLLGNTNIDAYIKTFPDRYQSFVDKGTTPKDIASYVTSYNKNKLVNLIFEQTLIPCHVLNQDIHQQAINQLASLMMGAKLEKVQCDAASKLVDALKPPEAKKIELDIGLKQDKSIDELREATMKLVSRQREMIVGGVSNAKEIAHAVIVDAEITEEE